MPPVLPQKSGKARKRTSKSFWYCTKLNGPVPINSVSRSPSWPDFSRLAAYSADRIENGGIDSVASSDASGVFNRNRTVLLSIRSMACRLGASRSRYSGKLPLALL